MTTPSVPNNTNPNETPLPAVPETHGIGHVMPMRILVAVFLSLVVLTFITVAITWVDLGNFNLYAALLVAGIKAALVVLFFMHLLYDRPFNAVVFLGCLVFVVLFISLAMTDSSAYHKQILPGQAPGVTHKPFDASVPAK